jgi:predicted secreted protein
MRKLCAVVVLLSSVSLSSFAMSHGHADAKHRVAMTNVAKPIMVTAHEKSATIRLLSNPSTGYTWLLTHYPDNLIEPMGSQFFPSKSKRMGASGYVQWTFKFSPSAFVVPQVIRVVLMHARPWDLSKSTPTTLTFVTVPAPKLTSVKRK